MRFLNKNLIAIAIITATLIIAGYFIFINQGTVKTETLSAKAAAEKVTNFINQLPEILEEGVTASLMDVGEESGVYKIHLKIGEQEYTSYVSKDGKLLFSSAFNLEEQPQEEPQAEEEVPPENLESFAKCLTEFGAKFYGSKYCGWCKKQKELFGDALQYLTYIECIDPQTDQWLALCREAGIDAVPTWEFNGELSPGFKTLEQLAELSGCQL